MKISYLTDAQVRATLVTLLERIDEKYWTEDGECGIGGLNEFWEGLGYDVREEPQL